MAHALLRAASVPFQKPYLVADSGGLRHNDLKAELLSFLGDGADLLFTVSGFVVFGSFIDILLSVFDESEIQAAVGAN